MKKEQMEKLREDKKTKKGKIKKGLTLKAIGEKAGGVSKQFIHQELNKEKYRESRRIYEAKYRQTEKYKKYQREYQLKRRQKIWDTQQKKSNKKSLKESIQKGENNFQKIKEKSV